jgi:hypothetical protein
MMAAIGFNALATSSGASAGLLGRRDGRVTRDEAMAQARVICEASDLPVSADLEKGFGDSPEIVSETIRLAAEAGLVGCSIEDASGSRAGSDFGFGKAASPREGNLRVLHGLDQRGAVLFRELRGPQFQRHPLHHQPGGRGFRDSNGSIREREPIRPREAGCSSAN